MKRLGVILALVFSWPAWSSPIDVRSGEHSEFTRLVVYLADGQKWNVSEADGLTNFSVEDWDQGFDISTVFRKINTERLKSLTASQGRLVMSFGCDCRVETTQLAGGFVSLDIREKARSRPLPKPKLPKVSDDAAVVISEVSQVTPREDLMEWPVVFVEDTSFEFLDQILANNSASPARAFENGLGEEIARGATLTYLQPSNAVLDRGPQGETEQSRTKDELIALLDERAQFSNAGEINSLAPEEVEVSCPAPSSVTVSEWGGDLPFADQLASLRQGIYSEFDEVDFRVVRDLARFYIHHAMIPEFNEVIENYGDQMDQTYLEDLANLIEGKFAAQNSLTTHKECAGETGFWSFYAGGGDSGISTEKIEKHIAVFQRFPRDLQVIVADRLIENLEENDNFTASGVVRNALLIDENPEGEFDQQVILKADLSSLSQEELLELSGKSDAQSPDALLVFLDHAIDTETPVTPDVIDLAGSFIHQLDGTEVSKRLHSKLVIALVQRGEGALGLAKILNQNEESFWDLENLRIQFATNLLSNANSSDIAKFAWQFEQRSFLKELPYETRLDLAQYLIEQGQPDLARLSLEGLKPSDVVSKLSAQAFAQLGQRNKAAGIASELSGEQLDPKLSEIVLTENPDTAWQIRDSLTGVAAERAAWISQRWSEVETEDARGETSLLLAGSLIERELSKKPIQDAQDAKDESKKARQILNELLN